MLRHHGDRWMRLDPRWAHPYVPHVVWTYDDEYRWKHPVIPEIYALDLYARIGGRGRSPIPGVTDGGGTGELYSGFEPTLYAAPTAQGTGSGTSEANAMEIMEALDTITAPGVLGLLNGIYETAYVGVSAFSALFMPTNSGSSGNQIRICSKYPALYLDTPGSNSNRSEFRQTGYTIGTNAVDPTIGTGPNRDYIEWWGVYLDQDYAPSAPSKGTIIVGNSSVGCRVEQIVCRQVFRAANDNYDTIFAHSTDDAVFRNNRFLEGGELNVGAPGATAGGYAGQNVATITLYGCKTFSIDHNDFIRNNRAIFVKGSNTDESETEPYNDGVIEYNYFEGCKTDCVDMNESNVSRSVIVRYNLSVDCMGFLTVDNPGSMLLITKNVTAYFNTVINSFDAHGVGVTSLYPYGGIRCDLQMNVSVWRDNIVYNDLTTPTNAHFHNLGGSGPTPAGNFDTTGFTPSDSLDRNCYYQANGTRQWKSKNTTYNTLAAWVSACQADVPGQEANSTNLNPLFTNVGAGDYTLSGSSPCLGTGTGGANMGCFQPGMTRADIGCIAA